MPYYVIACRWTRGSPKPVILLSVAGALAFGAPKPAPAQALAPQARYQLEREASLKSRSSEPGYWRGMLEAQVIIEVGRKYDHDPESFKIPKYTGPNAELRDLRPVDVVPTKQYVIDTARQGLALAADGLDLSGTDAAKAIAILSRLMPPEWQLGVRLGVLALPTIGGGLQGSPNELHGTAAEILREYTRLSESSNPQDRAAGAALLDVLRDHIRFDPTLDSYEHEPIVQVIREEEKRLQSQTRQDEINKKSSTALAALQRQSEANANRIATLERKERERAREEAKRAAKEEAARSYRETRAEVEGAGMGVGYAFRILGDEKSAQFVFQSTNLVTSMMDLSQMSAGSWAFFGSYMKTANLAMGLSRMAKDGGFEVTVVRQLQEILRYLDLLRTEIHARFARVDGSLWVIDQRVRYGISELDASLSELHLKANQLDQRLVDLRAALDAGLGDLEHSRRTDLLASCVPSNLNRTQFAQCITTYSVRANILSAAAQRIERALTAPEYGSYMYPFAGSYGVVFRELANQAPDVNDLTKALQHPPLEARTIGPEPNRRAEVYVPHPDHWLWYSDEFLRFLTRNPAQSDSLPLQDLDLFIYAGHTIQTYLNRLGFDDKGQLRGDFLKSILLVYETAVVELGNLVQANSKLPGLVNESDELDVISPDESIRRVPLTYFNPSYDIGDGRGQKIDWCGDDSEMIGSLSARLAYGTPAQRKDVADRSFGSLTPGIERLIPDSIRLAERLGLGRIGFCVKRIAVDENYRQCSDTQNRCSVLPYRLMLTAFFVKPVARPQTPAEVKASRQLVMDIEVWDDLRYEGALRFKLPDLVREIVKHGSNKLGSFPRDSVRWLLSGFEADIRPGGIPNGRSEVLALRLHGDSVFESFREKTQAQVDTALIIVREERLVRLYQNEARLRVLVDRGEEARNRVVVFLNEGVRPALSKVAADSVVEQLRQLFSPGSSVTGLAQFMYLSAFNNTEVEQIIRGRSASLIAAIERQAKAAVVPRNDPLIAEQLRRLCDVRATLTAGAAGGSSSGITATAARTCTELQPR